MNIKRITKKQPKTKMKFSSLQIVCQSQEHQNTVQL